jgi:predicted nucleic acid-binding protein
VAKFVVDANVAIKWVIPENHTNFALRLLDSNDNILLVPDFFFPEIGNIFWKRVRRGEATIDRAQESLQELTAVNTNLCLFASDVDGISHRCQSSTSSLRLHLSEFGCYQQLPNGHSR